MWAVYGDAVSEAAYYWGWAAVLLGDVEADSGDVVYVASG